jgi:hypothetical protein
MAECLIESAICSIGYKSQQNVTFKGIPSGKPTEKSRNLPKRSNSSVGKTSSSSGMGVRSVSVGTLNQAVGVWLLVVF